MKNIRIENDEIVFDCDSPECSTPGEPHKLPVDDFLAMMSTLHEEFSIMCDPRFEVICIALVAFLESYGLDEERLTSPEVKDKHDRYVEALSNLAQTVRDELEETVSVRLRQMKTPTYLN